jgi:hypothetical protein
LPPGYGGSNPPLSTSFAAGDRGVLSEVLSRTRKQAVFQVWAVVAQLVERVLGKDEVTSSILVNGSINFPGRLNADVVARFSLRVFGSALNGKRKI